jgi:iron complex transport system substrate-binding protein
VLVAGCGGSSSSLSSRGSAPATPALKADALGNPITIPAKAPQRIVSETPADSEDLAAVGAASRVVAVDFYTNYPADMASKQKITDGQSFNLNDEAIIALKPDLVLGYGGYFKSDEQKLLAANIPVVDLPVSASLEDTLNELRLVGQLVHNDDQTNRLVSSLQRRIAAVKSKVQGKATPPVYMEDGTYNGQYSTFGKGSYGDELIRYAGGQNIFAGDGDAGGYPNVSAESIIQANPQVIVLAEGVQNGGDPATAGSRAGWSAISAVQSHKVYAVDSDTFSRPGPRLVDALEQLAKLIHPEAFA